jgi:hypothetical protein
VSHTGLLRSALNLLVTSCGNRIYSFPFSDLYLKQLEPPALWGSCYVSMDARWTLLAIR